MIRISNRNIFRRSIARDASAKPETRAEESRFLSSLSLDRHSSRSILGKPGDFSPPSFENAKPPPVSRGLFLPSLPSREREGGRKRPRVSSMEFHIYPGVACSDSKRMRRYRKHSSVSGESRGLDETKLEGRKENGETFALRLGISSEVVLFFARSAPRIRRSSPRDTRESLPNSLQFLVSLYFILIPSASISSTS